MELNGIKNIIFDLGGVLLNLDFNLTQQAFVKLGVTDFDDYYAKAQQVGLFDDFETGKISEAEFCERLRNLTGISKSNDQIVDAWNAMLLDFPVERKGLVLNLKNRFTTALLSNTNETHIAGFLPIIKKDINENSLDSLFHSVHYSNEIGFRKPNKEAFQFVLDQNNFRAEETLFLDDSLQHIEGATKCGIHTVHINGVVVEDLFADFLA